jgi:hypothetical protein
VPDTSALFTKHALVERHSNLLKATSVAWALRNRATNGLEEAEAVFESQSGELLLYEPAFLRGTPQAARIAPIAPCEGSKSASIARDLHRAVRVTLHDFSDQRVAGQTIGFANRRPRQGRTL